MVALYLNIDSNEVMEGVLDDSSYVDLLDSLTLRGGKFGIMFYYQDGEPPSIGSLQLVGCCVNIVRFATLL